MTYTMKDLEGIVDGPLTASQEAGVLAYVNEGIIPPFDPCVTCEPNYIRSLIALVQIAEMNGTWPPKQPEPEEVEAPKPTRARKQKEDNND